MENENANAKALLEFIEKSPTAFQAVENMAKTLEAVGFCRLREQERWDIRPGGAYYVTRNDSSLIAFRTPKKRQFGGFQIIASHSDSPCFRLKENPEMTSENGYIRLNTEIYGGMIHSTWLDRPLSVAGRLVVREKKEGRTVLRTAVVNIDRDLAVIPSLAIHMNREANKGYQFNPQTDLIPIIDGDGAKSSLPALLAEAAGISPADIAGSDLFLYNRQKGNIWGARGEYISSPRLDDLACAYGSLRGILTPGGAPGEAADIAVSDAASRAVGGAADSALSDTAARATNAGDGSVASGKRLESENVCVHCLLDNEEVGSGTRQGAASTFLKETLVRISQAMGPAGQWREEDYFRQIAGSFLISADNAHAVHPNRSEKADPVNRPHMNEGIVIKFSGNQNYTSDGLSSAVLRGLCEEADVPVQIFTNRSDAPGGSTLGNISAAQVPVNSVDIGLPQLAMHSACETAGVKDITWLIRLAETFFASTVKVEEDGTYNL